MEEATSFYVHVEEPVTLRRHLLEASRGVLGSLQLYEDVRALQEQRRQAEHVYEQEMKIIQSLLRKLKKSMPKVAAQPSKKERQERSAARALEAELQSLEEDVGKLR